MANTSFDNWQAMNGETIEAGNLGMLVFEVNGHKKTYLAHTRIDNEAGWVDIPLSPFSSSLTVNMFREMGIGPTSKPTNRIHDTESRLLNKLHHYLVRNELSNASGWVALYTKLAPCLSCDYLIIEFLKLHSALTIEVFYQTDYPERPKKH